MPTLQQTIRTRTDGLPKAAVVDAITATVARIGGSVALLRALAEVENERARLRSRRRIRQLGRQQVAP